MLSRGFSKIVKTKVMGCNKTKEVWDKINVVYEGDQKVKQVKLQ